VLSNCAITISQIIITVELYLSGLIMTAYHPDMQKIRIIGFLFENRLHWQFEVEKKIIQMAVLGYIFIYVKIKHLYVIPYMCWQVEEKFKP
jgi:hypothetical protein